MSISNRVAVSLRVILNWIKRKGGSRQSYRTALAIFKREGWGGIKRKLLTLNAEMSMLSAGGLERNDYSEWISRYDTLSEKKRAYMRSQISNLTTKTVISIVMPTYNPRPEWLRDAIESVLCQIYPHWELCIADDNSTDPQIRPILEEYAAQDARIKVVFREKNGHISEASNSAIALTQGQWIALLDHDDLLAEHALYWVAAAFNEDDNLRLIYSDEDKIDDSDTRQLPYFKCDWNRDLIYSHNMFCHLGVYHRDLIEATGGFRVGFEGAQDYDLILRCIEQVRPAQIFHIPRVLYHWRMHADSTAQSSESKPYAMQAGLKALTEHFDRLSVGAKVKLTDSNQYQVTYPVPDPQPLVSLIIPTRNGEDITRQCIDSILTRTTYQNFEIILIDNGSDEKGALAYFASLTSNPRVSVIRDDSPFNYSSLNNSAVKIAKGDIIGLLNNDIEVISPGWLTEMVGHALRDEVGVVGSRLWYSNNTLQHGGCVLGIGGVAGHPHKHLPRGAYGYNGRTNVVSSVSAVTAACLIVRKSIYKRVGGLNERDLKVAFNDIDFCLRVKEAGYVNVYTPLAELYHYESITRGYEDTPEKVKRFEAEVRYMKERWGSTLLTDHAYNPNLTLEYEDCSLAWPPRIGSLYQQGEDKKRNNKTSQKEVLAVVIHAFYLDILDSLLSSLSKIPLKLKLYVTTSVEQEDQAYLLLNESGMDYHLLTVENRGRDILPFLQIMPSVIKGGHELLLKLHTKKSKLRSDGEEWREEVLEKLITPLVAKEVLDYFRSHKDVGMIGPEGHIVPIKKYWGGNQARLMDLASRMGIDPDTVKSQSFVAGTMFYARVSALKPLLGVPLQPADFEEESGQTDGTMAHVIERALAVALLSTDQRLIGTNLGSPEHSIPNESYKYTDA